MKVILLRNFDCLTDEESSPSNKPISLEFCFFFFLIYKMLNFRMLFLKEVAISSNCQQIISICLQSRNLNLSFLTVHLFCLIYSSKVQYKRPVFRPFVHQSVRPSVRLSVHNLRGP